MPFLPFLPFFIFVHMAAWWRLYSGREIEPSPLLSIIFMSIIIPPFIAMPSLAGIALFMVALPDAAFC